MPDKRINIDDGGRPSYPEEAVRQGRHRPPRSENSRSAEKLTAIGAERVVLGASLLDEAACAKAVELLEPEHFAGTSRQHAALFETIVELFSRGEAVDMTIVHQAGYEDAAYLADLTAEVAATSSGHVEYHARIVAERWMARRAVQKLQQAAADLKGGADVFDALAAVQHALGDLQLGGAGDTHIRHAVAEALRRTAEWQAGESSDVVPTGIYSLDKEIGGYPVGELTTIAAQTGAGKTSLIVQALRTLALAWTGSERGSVVLFSAEMSREQIAHRAASGLARVNLRDLRSGKAKPEEYERYDEALGRLAELDWHVDPTPSPSFAHIQARCQQIKQTGGLGFVAVDYDEKIDSEGQTEELRVSAIAKGLKNLAKRFEVPVVTLSQYSRAASDNTGFPKNAWLRYSGKKEQESALILHWYWPGYFVKHGKPPEKVDNYDPSRPGRGWIVCTKNRFGPENNALLYFQPQWTRFRDPNDPDEKKELPF